VGRIFLPALFLFRGDFLKEKDLKIKEKKDTLKVLDRNSRTPRQRDSRINTGMKAAFIRDVAGRRDRKAEDGADGTDSATRGAVETYETAAGSTGSYGAAKLKRAFQQEKGRERREQGRRQETAEGLGNPEQCLGQAETAAEDRGIHSKDIENAFPQPGYEPARGQDRQAPDRALQEGRAAIPKRHLRQASRKGGLQDGAAYPQGAKTYARAGAPYPQSNAVYPQDNMLKRDFLQNQHRKRENRKMPEHGETRKYQVSENSSPSSALPAGYGTEGGNAGNTAASKGVDKYKTMKRHGYTGNVERSAGGGQMQGERTFAENKGLPIVQKLKNRLLSEKAIYSVAGGKISFKARLRQSAERAAAALARDMLAALGGLGGAVVIMVIIAVVAALLSTSFGIFFSSFDHAEGTRSVSEIVAEVNGEFYAEATGIENSVSHDKVEYHNQPGGGSSLFITNWPDVVAVFSAKVSGDAGRALDAVTMDSERETLLKKVFWDMNVLSYDTEETGEGVVLHIRHTSKGWEEMLDAYHFTPYQRQAAAEMMKPEYAQMLSELIGTLGVSGGGSVALTPDQAREMLENLPENLTPERKAVMRAAYSLVGKVNYFWGGKSAAVGWDSRWGTPKKVTAAGSSMTGTTRPFGLDCSGFVTWAFINATGNPDYANIIGHGAANQYGRCKKILWNEAQPGDLVFYPDLGHVGIIAGTDADGNLLVVHCASSQNNVVVTGLQGFTRIGRPVLFG